MEIVKAKNCAKCHQEGTNCIPITWIFLCDFSQTHATYSRLFYCRQCCGADNAIAYLLSVNQQLHELV